jgi:hypothetical protein
MVQVCHRININARKESKSVFERALHQLLQVFEEVVVWLTSFQRQCVQEEEIV